MKNRMLLIIGALSVLLLSACAPAKNFGSFEGIALKTSPEGFKYKLVHIEGKTFVATQTYYDYWTLAGPID
jgi:hypothetical protein